MGVKIRTKILFSFILDDTLSQSHKHFLFKFMFIIIHRLFRDYFFASLGKKRSHSLSSDEYF